MFRSDPLLIDDLFNDPLMGMRLSSINWHMKTNFKNASLEP